LRAEERPLGATVSTKTSDIHDVDVLDVRVRAKVREERTERVRLDLRL
jgi:hypothetical protein